MNVQRRVPTVSLNGAMTMAACLALTVSGGCAEESRQESGSNPFANATTQSAVPEMPTFAPELNIDIEEMDEVSAGLYRRDLVIGEGAFATPGDLVNVHYTGWLPDGKQFDSSRSSGRPFTFQLGERMVIDGWDLGVAGMREGGKRQLVIPPDLGYGATGSDDGVIPPSATLVFEVELISVD